MHDECLRFYHQEFPAMKPNRDTDTLKLLGLNPATLSRSDQKTAIELARRLTACDRIPGAGKRRGKAMADWKAFIEKLKAQAGGI
jgi:hypothetical protein